MYFYSLIPCKAIVSGFSIRTFPENTYDFAWLLLPLTALLSAAGTRRWIRTGIFIWLGSMLFPWGTGIHKEQVPLPSVSGRQWEPVFFFSDKGSFILTGIESGVRQQPAEGYLAV